MNMKSFLLFCSYAYSKLIKIVLWPPMQLLWVIGLALQAMAIPSRQSVVVDNFKTQVWFDFVSGKLSGTVGQVSVGSNAAILFSRSTSQEYWRFKTLFTKEKDTVTWLTQMADRYPLATLVDVGANIGIYSLLWLKLSEGRVKCFEPLPSNVMALLSNIKLNDFQNRAEVYQVAVVEKIKLLTFQSPTLIAGEGFASIGQPRDSKSKHVEYMVSGIDLSSISIDAEETIVKVDVEGTELEVVRSLHRHLNEGKIKSIIFEKNPKQDEIVSYLSNFGLSQDEQSVGGNIVCSIDR